MADYHECDSRDFCDNARDELTAAQIEGGRLRKAIEFVLDTFEKSEAHGYRSRDRQFAISILRKALESD